MNRIDQIQKPNSDKISGIISDDFYKLTQVDEGRLFFRETSGAQFVVVGLISLPKDAPDDHLVVARLNNSMWLDLDHPVDPCTANRNGSNVRRGDENGMGGIGEYGVGELLTNLLFARLNLADAVELFIRKSELPHSDPKMAWFITAGAMNKKLTSMPGGGLYEISKNGIVFVDNSKRRGEALLGILREPIWGRDGNHGVAHSMATKTYPHFIKKDREASMRKDPRFAKYVEQRIRELPERLHYTRQQWSDDNKVTSRIVRDMLNERKWVKLPNITKAETRKLSP